MFMVVLWLWNGFGGCMWLFCGCGFGCLVVGATVCGCVMALVGIRGKKLFIPF